MSSLDGSGHSESSKVDYYRTLFEFAKDAIFVETFDGQIVDVNPAACTLLGYSREELLAMNLLAILPPDEQVPINDLLQMELVTEGKSFTGHNIRKDGKLIPVEIRINDFWQNGDKYLLVTARDVTLRTEVFEKVRRQNEYLTSFYRINAGMLNHLDLRNNLQNIVKCACELLGAPDGFVCLVDETIGELDFRIGVGRFANNLTAFKLGEGVIGRVWQNGQPLVIEDYSNWAGRHRDSFFDTAQTCIGIPLKNGEKVIGVIGVDFFDKPHHISTEEMAVFNRFAELASVALVNAQLYTRIADSEKILQERHQELTAINDKLMATEEQLLEQYTEYQSLFMNMPSGFIYVRVIYDEQETAVDFEYLKVNEAYEKMVGVSREGIIGKRFSELLPAFAKSYAARLAVEGEVALGRSAKAEIEYYSELAGRWFSSTVYSPVKGYAVAIITDVTERRQNQQALERAKNEAEAANRAKSEFLANMSHEIRTPINGINGMIELTMLNDLSSEQKDNLLTAKSCIQALVGIINDILDFSKMEVGKLAIDKVNFRCQDIIDEVVKVHAQSALSKEIDLSYSFPADIPAVLAGDPNRLRQVLNNLLGNAIKFTGSGRVALAVKLTGTVKGRVELTFFVTDTGIGISSADMKKLFQPFSQVDGSNTRRYGGTGLGLAISKQLVERMGGRIWVESVKGKGSTFAFNVGLAPANSAGKIKGAARQQQVEIQPATKELSVLLVEDDAVSRMIIQKYLRELKHKVDSAADGRQAVELFAQNRYDLVLMDIQMPVMDGVEATRVIRETEADSDRYTPIIAITANALAGDREKYLAAGMDEYISKPLQIGELQAKIELLTSPDAALLQVISGVGADVAETDANDEQSKILDEITCLNQMIDRYYPDLKLFEGFVNKIKLLANQSGLEEIKALAFKAELAARRGNIEEAVSFAYRIHQIIETYRKTDIMP